VHKLVLFGIKIGAILVLPKNLYEALEEMVVQTNVPIIRNVVHAAHKQYNQNIFTDNKYLTIDEIVISGSF